MAERRKSYTDAKAEDVEVHCNCQYLWINQLHGIAALMMADTFKQKLLWTFMLIVCALVCILNADITLTNYMRNRSATKISVVQVKSIQLPAIIFCPKNADALNYTSLEDAFSYIHANVGQLDGNVTSDLLSFVVAGSGFDNIEVVMAWNDSYRAELQRLYDMWKGNRSVVEMFEFVFEQNGYLCSHLFHSCFGPRAFNCCEVFKPTYALLRGRCFRMAYGHNQTAPDEAGKLTILLNYAGGRLAGKKNLPTMVMYLGDSHPQVGLLPRIYLQYRSWNRIRLAKKRFSMLSENSQCSTKLLDQGLSTCFLHTFMHSVVVSPLNCTFPYFKELLPDNIPVCDPLVIIKDYERISSKFLHSQCVPACEREEITMLLTAKPDRTPNITHSFRVEVSFTNLEYEHYSEAPITTAVGFISEIGGQSSLFLGCSLPSFVHFFLGIVLLLHASFAKIYNKFFVSIKRCAFGNKVGAAETRANSNGSNPNDITTR